MTAPAAPDAASVVAPDDEARGGGAFALFVLLGWAGLRNRVRVQLRRMRSPRYAVPLVVGAVYMWYFLFRGNAGTGAGMAGAALGSEAVETALSLGVLALAVNWWLFGGDRAALAFSPAEADFLFPAPLTRRQLIHFKLLRAQALVAVNVAVWILITRRGSPDVPLGLRAIAFWALISTMQLHRLAASLVRSSAVEHGASGARRNAVAIAAIVGVVAALVAGVLAHRGAVIAASSPTALAHALGLAFGSGPARWALWPVRAVLAPAFAESAAAWRATILPALGMVGLHYLWVVRTDAAFEEAALDATARRAEQAAARRARAQGRALPAPASTGNTGASRLPFGRPNAVAPRLWVRLSPSGRPGIAITWKNVVAATRTTNPIWVIGPVAVLAVAIAAGAWGGGRSGALMHVAAVMLTTGAAVLVCAGPVYVRNDLRLDMPKLELLRAYPLRGREVVAAEIAAPLSVLTAMQIAALALAAGAASGAGMVDASVLREPAVWTMGAAALVALPALNAAGLTVQNASALLFPSWMRLGTTRGGGVESLGQNLVAVLVNYVLLLLFLTLPIAIGGGAALYVAGPGALLDAAELGGAPPPHVAAALVSGLALALLALWGEVAVAVGWLGRVFDRTEPTAE